MLISSFIVSWRVFFLYCRYYKQIQQSIYLLELHDVLQPVCCNKPQSPFSSKDDANLQRQIGRKCIFSKKQLVFVGMFLVLDKFDVFSAADYQLGFFLSKVAK